jgi:O-antigen ligase
MLNKLLLKLSLYFTNTGFIPLSPIASIIGLFALILKIFTNSKFYKFEFFLLISFVYFILSAAIFFPSSLFEYNFYRYDGNFIISYLPIFALSFCRPILNYNTIKKFVIYSSLIYFFYFLFWITTKSCSLGSGACSFGGLYEARNATGGFLSILTVMAFIGWKNGIRNFKYIFIIMSIVLISTISRGSILGVGIALLIYLIYLKKGIMIDKFLFILFLIFSITISVFFYDKNFNYSNESSVTSEFVDSEATSKEANVWIRFGYLFPKALEIFMKNPIFGAGVSSFNDYGLNIINSQIYSSAHAHNSYLHFLSEMGLVGFSVYMIFFYYFRRFWINNRQKNTLMADIAYFSFLAVAFASFTEHRITTPSSMILVSLLIGAFASLVRFQTNLHEKITYEVTKTYSQAESIDYDCQQK